MERNDRDRGEGKAGGVNRRRMLQATGADVAINAAPRPDTSESTAEDLWGALTDGQGTMDESMPEPEATADHSAHMDDMLT